MKRLICTLLLLLPMLAVTAFAEDYYILRIDTADVEDRAVVANAGIDILYVSLEEGWLWARVPMFQLDEVQKMGFANEIIDVKAMPSGYEPYHDYAESTAFVQDLAAQYPDITSLFVIGQSVEGRDLYCLKISDNPDVDETDEGAFLLVAQHHAREILTPEVAIYTAQQLLQNYGVDEKITFFVDNREIYIIPTINPDGSEFDQNGTWFSMWRKNRRVNQGSSCMGVDLNRNYGYEWGGVGSSPSACSETYHGASAFSEPETAALRDLVYAHENITTLISLHTYAKLVLYPWGYQYPHIGDQIDYQTHKTLAEYMADFNGYTPQQAAQLYPTTGDTTDWAYGELGITAFTFEMEPTQLNPMGFYPQPATIQTACEGNYPAILLAIGLSRDPSRVLSSDLWKLEADLQGSSVNITWAPIVETNAQGWNVMRSVDGSAFAQLNDAIIAPGQDEYTFTDSGVADGKLYQYRVDFVSTYAQGNQEFGPLEIDLTGDDDDATDDDATPDDDDATDDDVSDDDLTDDDAADDDDDDDDDDGCGC